MDITFETEETVVLRQGSTISVAECSACGRAVLMATPQAAGFLSGRDERQVFRLIEAGTIHFVEGGCVLVCLESLKLIEVEAFS